MDYMEVFFLFLNSRRSFNSINLFSFYLTPQISLILIILGQICVKFLTREVLFLYISNSEFKCVGTPLKSVCSDSTLIAGVGTS